MSTCSNGNTIFVENYVSVYLLTTLNPPWFPRSDTVGHIQGGLTTDSHGLWGTQSQWIHVQHSSSIYDSSNTQEEGRKVVTARILGDLSCSCLSEKVQHKQTWIITISVDILMLPGPTPRQRTVGIQWVLKVEALVSLRDESHDWLSN